MEESLGEPAGARVKSGGGGGTAIGRAAPAPGRPNLHRQVVTIVASYAVAAGLWIALSDRLLAAMVRDPDGLVRMSLFKGFAFVAATSGLLYLLLQRSAGVIARAFAAVDHKEAERVRHEAERRRAEAIVEWTEDAIVSGTLDGKITSWNPSAERMFGYAAAEVLGRPIEILLPPDCAEEEARLVERLRRGEHISHFETVRVRKDGTAFSVSTSFSPIWAPAVDALSGRIVVGMSNIIRDTSAQRAAEALAARERRFSLELIGAMPGVFYLYDERRRFVRWNDNLERVTGRSAEEIANIDPLDLFPARDRELVAQRIAEVFARGESSVEASLRAKDGRETAHFFTGRRVVFDGAICLIGVGVDVSEQKRVEAALSTSKERFRTTLDNILEGCQILDFDWRYLYLNGAAEVQNRRPNRELLGRRMPDVWPGIEGTTVFGLLKRSLVERIALNDEIEFTFPDGVTGWFDVRAQPVPEGLFVLSIDISERKRAETELRELNDSLERKVAERTRELAAARERAEAADRIKSAFLATMSHELRTPLNSIIGFTSMVMLELPGPLNPEQSKQLGMVQSSARHLLDLINDVLDISKIEAGQLEINVDSFDLRASMQRVVALVTPLAAKKKLTLACALPELPQMMESDRRRVEQILLNLLNNGIKFTDRGEVSLSLEVVHDATAASGTSPGAVAHLRVRDTGIGMRPEDLGKLFQPFRQIDAGLQRQHEGTGLGLAICRRLTDLLGGKIQVASEWGKGSVFTVSLPMKRSKTP